MSRDWQSSTLTIRPGPGRLLLESSGGGYNIFISDHSSLLRKIRRSVDGLMNDGETLFDFMMNSHCISVESGIFSALESVMDQFTL